MSVTAWISARDHSFMGRMERWRAPRTLRWWMIYSTRGGDGWLWFGAALVLLAVGGEPRYRALLSCTTAILCGVALFSILKRVCKRPRPRFAELCNPSYGMRAPAPPDMFSFPSGHTITAFAAAVNLFHYYPPMAPLLLFLAASIAASRVMLGMHYPSDVVAGGLIGTLLGYLAFVFVA